MSVTVEGPPPVVNDDKTGLMAGPGKGVAAGRGMPLGAGKLRYVLIQTARLRVTSGILWYRRSGGEQ